VLTGGSVFVSSAGLVALEEEFVYGFSASESVLLEGGSTFGSSAG